MEQKPTIGRIVHYHTTDADTTYFESQSNAWKTHNKGGKLPAIITAVWSDNCINVQVIVDGVGPNLWKTSILEGVLPGMWTWPERV